MFLCDECHRCESSCTFCRPSRGPCEACGEVADCTDCHSDLPPRRMRVIDKNGRSVLRPVRVRIDINGNAR